MKRVIFILLIISVLLVGGCGVPEEKYNQVVTDLEDLKMQYGNLEKEYTDCQAQYEKLQGQHSDLEMEIQQLKDALNLNTAFGSNHRLLHLLTASGFFHAHFHLLSNPNLAA